PTGWLARFHWLAIRNPINYFQYKVLGRELSVNNSIKKIKGDLKVGTHDWNTRGYYYQEVENDGETLWELYVVYPLFKNYHFRLRMGWKIGGYFSRRSPGEHMQWVLAITPFKKLGD